MAKSNKEKLEEELMSAQTKMLELKLSKILLESGVETPHRVAILLHLVKVHAKALLMLSLEMADEEFTIGGAQKIVDVLEEIKADLLDIETLKKIKAECDKMQEEENGDTDETESED